MKNQVFCLLIYLSIALFFNFPQLNSVHYDPTPQFWAEISVAYIVIATFSISITFSTIICIPLSGVFLLIFAIVLVIQPFFMHINFFGLSLVASSEILLCILFAISTATLIEIFGLTQMVNMICVGLVIGGILQSVIGLIQYNNWMGYFHGYIFYDANHPNTNIFGHFGQRNHYAHYLTWATFSLVYLTLTKKVNQVIFLGLSLWFIFSMTIASSRSVFLYFGFSTIGCGLYWMLNRKDKWAQQLLIYVLSITITLIAFEYLYPHLQSLFHKAQISSGLERISQENGTGRRMVEWKKAWLIFTQHPILGIGFNQYAKQSVLLHHLYSKAPVNDGLFTNCHNLLLQLLAETGIIGASVIVGGIVLVSIRIFKQQKLESIILSCFLITTTTHSMLEYPLWYMYFLVPYVMFLSCDKPILRFNIGMRFKSIAYAIAVGLIYIFVVNSFTYNKLVINNDPPDDSSTFVNQAHYLENIVDHNMLWSYYGLFDLDNYININDPNTNKALSTSMQLYYEQELINFHPYPDSMVKVAMLNWNLGNHQEAYKMVELAYIGYPVYIRSFLNKLYNSHYHNLYHYLQNIYIKNRKPD